MQSLSILIKRAFFHHESNSETSLLAYVTYAGGESLLIRAAQFPHLGWEIDMCFNQLAVSPLAQLCLAVDFVKPYRSVRPR